MMGFGMGMMGGGGFSLVLWVLVIVGIVYFLSNNRNKPYHSHEEHYGRPNRAEDIAKERYAKGEISKAELDEILRELKR